MPTDIHDPSPTKKRRLRIVRVVLFSIAILLPLAAMAAIVGLLATGVWGGEVQIVQVEKIVTVQVQKVVTVERPVETVRTVEVKVEKIVVATPAPTATPTPAPCPSDAEREYLTSLGHLIVSRDNAAVEFREVYGHLDDDNERFFDPDWRESITTAIADVKSSLYSILELRGPASVQAIRDEVVDWARHDLAAFDFFANSLDADDLADLIASWDKDALGQHTDARDASLELSLREMTQLCESPSDALTVFWQQPAMNRPKHLRHAPRRHLGLVRLQRERLHVRRLARPFQERVLRQKRSICLRAFTRLKSSGKTTSTERLAQHSLPILVSNF